MIRKIASNTKARLWDGLCNVTRSIRSFNPADNLLIFSSPRSGSTWLAELISTLPGTVMLWEPLHLRNVKEFRDIGFGWRQHIPENEQWKEAEEVFEKLFAGELLNFWLSSKDFPLKFCRADRMIIKFVRANGMLPWLTKTFEFKRVPIFLLRHPFAVAASQMKEGSWDHKLELFRVPDMPFNDAFKKHAPFLSGLKSKQQRIVANWCINNKAVLENTRNNKDWINLYYEDLLLNPEGELKRIFDKWEIPMPDGVLNKVSKASSTTVEVTFQKDLKAQLSKWKAFFSDEQVEQLQMVLDYFEIDIYSSEIMPQVVS